MKKETISQHTARMQKSLSKAKGMYEKLGQRFSVNPQTILWRSRFQGIYLFSMMGLWLQKHPTDQMYGQTIKEWRLEFPNVGAVITRTILALGATQEKFITAEVEVACKDSSDVGLSSIKDVIARGVALKLIKPVNGHGYKLTDLCIEEAFDRVMWKMMTPEIVEFSKYVTTFANLRELTKDIGDLEQTGALGQANFRSLNEEMFAGTYDDEIYEHNDKRKPATGSE